LPARLTPEVDAMVDRACACAKQVSLDFIELGAVLGATATQA
jgi:hypothetical protein